MSKQIKDRPININDSDDALIEMFKALTKKGEFNGGELLFGCSYIANLELVDRRNYMGGLDPVLNPMLFTGQLVAACKRRVTYVDWAEKTFPKTKSESELRGFTPDDVIQGSPYVKGPHWTIVNIHVAHEARSYFGLEVPRRVPVDAIGWILKTDEQAKVEAEAAKKDDEALAAEITEMASWDGKILSEGEEGVKRYFDGVVRNMQESRVERERTARRLALNIAALMECEEYSAFPAGADEDGVNSAVREQVILHFGRLYKFLVNTRNRMLKLARWKSAMGDKARQIIPVIDSVFGYAASTEYAEEIERRKAQVRSILGR